MTIGPRFFDMSTIIDSLAFYSGREPLDLFRIYYDRLCQLTGLEIGYRDAFRELKLCRSLDIFWSLPWLLELEDSELSKELDIDVKASMLDLHQNLTDLELL
jgi:hypothetical protein